MADSFLTRFLSEVTECLQDPSTSKRYPTAQRISDLAHVQEGIFTRLLNGAGAESELGYTEKLITFVEDQEYYRLPPLFRQFKRLELRDGNDPRIVLHWLPSLDTFGTGPGVRILRDQNTFQVVPKTPANWVGDWTLCYRRGPARLHDGTAQANDATSIDCPAVPTNGEIVTLEDYYAGCVVNIFDGDDGFPQTNVCTGSHFETDHVVLEFDGQAWDPVPTGTVKYEIMPELPLPLDSLYALDTAIMACARRPTLRRRAGLLLERDDLWRSARNYYANTVMDRPPRRTAPPRPYAQDPYD